MPKQQQSLFSFFSPKAKPENRSALGENNNDNKNSSEWDGLREGKENKGLSSELAPTASVDQVESSTKWSLGDLVWAKIDGYPWWPSMVCNHPTKNVYVQLTKKKKTEVHVQFFDDPPTRGWVRDNFVREFAGLNVSECRRGGLFYSSDPDQYAAGQKAESAQNMSKDERLEKLLVLIQSDEEDDELEEIQQMDLDGDIFDNEVDDADAEANTSKGSTGSNKESKTSVMDVPEESPLKKSRTGRPQKKRRRIKLSDLGDEELDSGDEFKALSDESDDDASSGVDEDEVSSNEPSDTESPVKKPVKRKRPPPKTKKISDNLPVTNQHPSKTSSAVKKFRMPSLSDDENDTDSPNKSVATPSRPISVKQSTPNSSVFSPSVSSATKSKLEAFSAAATPADQSMNEGQVYTHLTLDFLKPEQIMDKYKHRPDHPEYDPRTLYVPNDFMSKQTPAHKQWWAVKVDHFDTILFFKVGKFYELFHMDSVVAVKELGLIYMKGNYAHSGFPEIAYGRYADILVQKGYKVGRVEQTETPEMLNERMKQTSKKVDKVVRREVCRITTKGTKTFNFVDGNLTGSAENNFLMAVCEKESESGKRRFGVCFVDTSIGKFRLGEFDDDRHSSRFSTLVAHYRPVQILHERGRLSKGTYQLLTNTLPTAIKEGLTPGKEFWSSGKTLKILSEADYFKDPDTKEGDFSWPAALKSMLSCGDTLGLTAGDDYQMAISALGAVTWYLSDCQLDVELLSMRQFEAYEPIDSDLETEKKQLKSAELVSRACMVLDGVTLANLEVLENSTTGDQEGTLLERLDLCSTPFGKRLFRQWVCGPLCNPHAINQRLDAVDDLIACFDLVPEVKETLKKIPDLDRLLSKIHTLGSATRSKDHPDSRAIFYEDVIYSKRKIEDFLNVLSGFKMAMKIAQKLQKAVPNFKSDLLKQTVSLSGDGRFPDLTEDLDYFDKAFNHEQAKKDGKIKPAPGVDEEYDASLEDISTCTAKFDDYLAEQKNELGTRNIVYWGTGRNRFQLEIPETLAKRIPNNYTLKSSKKGYKRYWSDEIESMLADLTAAEDRKDAAVKDVMRRIFYSFDKRYKKWSACVECISVLDVLICMTEYSRCAEGDMVRPEIVLPMDADDERPVLEIRGGRHPCITRTYSGSDFIPNDIVIGMRDDNGPDGDKGNHGDGSVVVVTGPNMGGKSTLMRQAGLIVILAQMGCYVPCTVCRLSPVDRIFTRLGASDRIMSGESTFFVELSETAAILQHATRHSLVLMDELGRGTATYDGTAIASAVVRELSQQIVCRTLFSTHYHTLVEQFAHDPNVRLGHMACMVEDQNDEDPCQETITFLYKFIPGACPKSYGFNAARLADLPDTVIRTGHQKARDLEKSLDKMKLFRLLQSANVDNVQETVNRVKALMSKN